MKKPRLPRRDRGAIIACFAGFSRRRAKRHTRSHHRSLRSPLAAPTLTWRASTLYQGVNDRSGINGKKIDVVLDDGLRLTASSLLQEADRGDQVAGISGSACQHAGAIYAEIESACRW
jgi:hypothetical protein